MHYGRADFCKKPCPGDTIVVLQPSRPCAASIGQRNGLSAGDIAAVKQMYPTLGFAKYFTAAPLTDGRLELWAIDRDGNILSRWKFTTNPSSAWTNWSVFPGNSGHFAAAPLSDGRLELWAIDTNGGIWSCWKITTDPSSAWTKWSAFDHPPRLTRYIAAAPLSDKRLQLWAIDTNGGIWSCWKITTDPNSGWTPWSLIE